METKRNKIGFFFYQEQEEVIIENSNPLERIINEPQAKTEETGAIITPAHKEVLERIELTKAVIEGENFSLLAKNKKQEFLNELIWLTEINAQLTFSY